MKIQYVKGSLLEAPHRFILHGVNAQGVMGAGVAAMIRNRWPEAYEVYRTRHASEGLRLGDYMLVPAGDKVIINAVTQWNYGPGQQVSYAAIEHVMYWVDRLSDGHRVDCFGNPLGEIHTVAMPLIGCGLGGGSWKRISGIIESCFERVQPVVYHLGQIPED